MTVSTSNLLLRAAAVAALLAVAAPAAAQRRYAGVEDSSFRLRLGQFEPRGDSDYWNEKFADFTGDIDQFDDIAFGQSGPVSVDATSFGGTKAGYRK